MRINASCGLPWKIGCPKILLLPILCPKFLYIYWLRPCYLAILALVRDTTHTSMNGLTGWSCSAAPSSDTTDANIFWIILNSYWHIMMRPVTHLLIDILVSNNCVIIICIHLWDVPRVVKPQSLITLVRHSWVWLGLVSPYKLWVCEEASMLI